jgi:transcriptional regulator with XRE-family HTH domain
VNERDSFAVDLHRIRVKLGLTHNAMAELLYTSGQTYRNWEGDGRPRNSAAERIKRFITSAEDQLHWLEENGVNVDDLLPLNLAASTLGVPHETLFHVFRDGRFEGLDLGILGIWVRREDLELILDTVLAQK